MNSLEFLQLTRPLEFAMRERLKEAAKTGNPEGLPWWQADVGRFLKAEGSGADQSYTFVISTPTVDRYGDIMEPDGMDNKAFRQNAVVPWGHSTDLLPIGKSLDERIVTGKHVEADLVFDLDNDPDDFAAAIKGKVDKGHLSATSVRFNPREYEPIVEEVELANGGVEEWWTGGFHVKEWELLEWSIVSVPANPETVRKAYGMLSKSVPEDDLDEKIREVLEKLVPDMDELRRQVTAMKTLVDQFENDPKGVIQRQVQEALAIERATDTFRDLQSHIGGS
jgi:hypothetical protein